MDAAGQLAELVEGERQFLAQPGKQAPGVLGVPVELGLGLAQDEREPHQARLRSVVQVALQAPAAPRRPPRPGARGRR